MLAIQHLNSSGNVVASQPMMGGVMDWIGLNPTTATSTPTAPATEAAPATQTPSPTTTTPPMPPAARPWYKDWRVWAGVAGGTVALVGVSYLVLR